MRILLERSGRTIELEDEMKRVGFLQLLMKALEALDYTKEDLKRFLEED